ncbi:MAG: hypothetical protein GX193_05635, partial [Clostridiales bacterium]|nr:hypothetical protein [Clostridiales bacterium]
MKLCEIKKVLILLTVFALLFTFAACDMPQPKEPQPSPSAVSAEGKDDAAPGVDDNDNDPGRN